MSKKSIEFQMKEITQELAKQIDDAITEAMKEPPKLAKKQIMNNAPRNTGEYRSGWKIKRHRRPKSAIVYNDKAPGKAHLLEFGHVIKNKNGSYGRAPAHPHIKPAEVESVNLFIQTLDDELNSFTD